MKHINFLQRGVLTLLLLCCLDGIATAQLTGTGCPGGVITLTYSVVPTQIAWQLNGVGISTVTATVSTAGVTVTSADLDAPTGIFVDDSGNMYITCVFRNRVQKWTPGAMSGITVAGQDDGSAEGGATGFYDPADACVDASGNIYVSDFENNRIQKWAPGATAGTTVAGQSDGTYGSDANELYGPWGLCLDGSRNVYVADVFNNRVQKWAPGATAGTTVAGQSNGSYGSDATQLSGPNGVYVDGSGNIYVADGSNNRIQKWAPGATTGTTVAGQSNGTSGSGATQLNDPYEVYVDGDGNVYVADAGNNRIQKWAPGATAGTTVAGTGTAGGSTTQLHDPLGIYLDGSGDIYVADYGNNRAQEFVATIVNTITATTLGNYTAQLATTAGATVTTNTVTVGPSADAGIIKGIANVCPGASITLHDTVIIGQSYEGGTVAYVLQSGDPGYSATLQHGLIVAPSDQSTGAVWYSGGVDLTGASGTAIGTGYGNTNTIVAAQGIGSYAAYLCRALSIGGYTDWYLPSENEATELYNNKASLPGISSTGYWTSTEGAPGVAGLMNMSLGTFNYIAKSDDYNVRAIRSFSGPSGSWSSSSTLIATVGSTGIVTGVAGGTATISYGVTGTCGTVYATYVVTVNALPGAGTIAGTATACISANTALTDAVSGGIWSSGTTSVATVGTTGIVTGAAAGTAVISYRVTNACTNYVTYTVTINALPVINAGQDVSIYTGSSTVLTASGATTYSWLPSAGLSLTAGTSVTATPTATTTYTVTGTAGCSNIAEVTVYVDAVPTLAGSTSCPGSVLTVTSAALPSQIVWQQGGIGISTVTATINSAAATVAGGNGFGSGAAQLAQPAGVYIDGSGNVYVDDQFNSRIEEWTPGATAGITVAGGHGAGSGATQLSDPSAVYVDGSGNVYVADFSNNRIQKWAPGATAGTTVAGGYIPGRAATQLNSPTGVYVDGSGNIYVADNNNNRVQEWAPGATVGTTVAGQSDGTGGSAATELNEPLGVYVDGSRNIYVADAANARIQEWAPGATAGVTVAGGEGYGAGAAQFEGTAGLFVDGSGNIYVADNGNNRIQKWAPGATAGITVAGGGGNGSGATQLYGAGAVYLDGSGDIYVADVYNNRVQEFAASVTTTLTATSTGNYNAVVTTIAGTATTNTVNVSGVPTSTGATNSGPVCNGGTVTLNDNSTGATHWSWVGSDGTTSPFQSPSMAPAAITTYSLTLSNSCGTNTVVYTTTVMVDTLPVVYPITGSSVVCVGSPTSLFESINDTSIYIGLSYGGGIIAYILQPGDPGYNNSLVQGLIVSSADQGGGIDWYNGPYQYLHIDTLSAIGTGLANTNTIISVLGLSGTYAAEVARNYNGGGYTDWYLPSWNELTAIYNNRAEIGGLAGEYWSSSESSGYLLRALVFDDGSESDLTLDAGLNVRAIRSFSIPVSSFASVAWSSSNTPVATVDSAGVISGVTPGTATISYSISNICGSSVATIAISVNATPTVNVSPATTICRTSSATLTASGGDTYSWSPSTGLPITTGASVSAGPSTTTVYTVTGTTNGCSNTAAVMVSVNALPTIHTSAAVMICDGSSTTLTATGGSTYSWSPSASLLMNTGTSVTADPSATTIYTVVGTLTTGCSNKATVTVSVNPLPTIDAGSNITICNGSSTTLTATGGNTYSWSPSTGLPINTGTSVTADPSATTIYTVVGTLTTGCSNTAIVIVSVNPLPTINAGSNVMICNGSSSTLTATGGNTYSWSPSTGLPINTGASVTTDPSATTIYTVTGTTNGCTNTATVMVSVNPLPTINAGSNVTICNGSSATLTATGGNTYSWSPSTGLPINTGASVTADPSATTVYTVLGTTNGCSNIATITVSVNPLPTIDAGSNVTICNGSSATLTATGGSTYSWSPSTGLPINTGASVTADPSATTIYTVAGTLATGCSNTATVMVSVNPLPTIDVGSNVTICNGSSATLTATGGNTYSWSPSIGLLINTGTSVTADPSATTIYTVVGTLATGCSNTATIMVSVNPLPTIDVGSNVTICNGSSATLTATGGNTYSWSPSIGLLINTGTSVTADPSATMVYTVLGTTNGCSNTATVMVSVNPLPTIDAGSNITICNGSSTTLTATSGNTYSWSPSTGLPINTGASVTADPSATTIYTVVGTLATGCSNTATVMVSVNPLPTIDAGSNVTICNGSSTTLTATGGNTYSWSPSTSLPINTGTSVTADPSTTTIYTVTGTTNGCTNTATVMVSVNPLPTINAGSNVTICNGSSATLTATGGTTYSWSPSTSLPINTGTNVTADPSTTTIYTVTGTTNGCTNTATVMVSVNPLPTIDAGSNVTICNGSSSTLTATEGNTYSWSPSTGLPINTGASVTADPSATTIYTVVGTLATGCSNKATVTVSVNPLPTIDAGSNVTICNGSSATLTATGGSTYSWSPSTGLPINTGTSVTADPSATTIYTVVGTLATGCSNTATVMVSVNPLPIINAGSNVTICNGSSTTLTATGGNTYSWSPSTGLPINTGTSVTADPSATTVYTVLGTTDGCSNTAIVMVSVNSLPAPILGASNVCAGSTTTLSDMGTGSWSSSNTNVTVDISGNITGVIAGSAIITYTLPNTCIATIAFTVDTLYTPSLTISSAQRDTICQGTLVTFMATSTNGGTSPVYIWMRNGMQVTTGPTYELTPANDDHILCALVSSLQCKSIDTASSGDVVMKVDTAYIPIVNIITTNGSDIQAGVADTFEAIVTNGGAAPTYQWVVNSAIMPGATNAVYSSNAFSDNDSISCIVTAAAPCGYSSFNSVIIHIITAVAQQYATSVQDLRLVPNPNKGSFTVIGSVYNAGSEDVLMEVTDMLGQVVYKKNIIMQNEHIKETILLNTTLSNGIYMLNIYSGTEHYVCRFVIER